MSEGMSKPKPMPVEKRRTSDQTCRHAVRKVCTVQYLNLVAGMITMCPNIATQYGIAASLPSLSVYI